MRVLTENWLKEAMLSHIPGSAEVETSRWVIGGSSSPGAGTFQLLALWASKHRPQGLRHRAKQDGAACRPPAKFTGSFLPGSVRDTWARSPAQQVLPHISLGGIESHAPSGLSS